MPSAILQRWTWPLSTLLHGRPPCLQTQAAEFILSARPSAVVFETPWLPDCAAGATTSRLDFAAMQQSQLFRIWASIAQQLMREPDIRSASLWQVGAADLAWSCCLPLLQQRLCLTGLSLASTKASLPAGMCLSDWHACSYTSTFFPCRMSVETFLERHWQ